MFTKWFNALRCFFGHHTWDGVITIHNDKIFEPPKCMHCGVDLFELDHEGDPDVR